MFSKWFVIKGQDLWDEDYLNGTPWTSGGNIWVKNSVDDGV